MLKRIIAKLYYKYICDPFDTTDLTKEEYMKVMGKMYEFKINKKLSKPGEEKVYLVFAKLDVKSNDKFTQSIKESSDRLAEVLREVFGDPNKL